MGLILCLETATKNCSVALVQDGKLLACKEEVSERYSHSEQLTVFIQTLLEEEHFQTKDLDAISVSKGPGSYTGLRIGVSTAKALCFALNKPLLAISTLEAMAVRMAQKQEGKVCCPMIDARRMEVYCSMYKGGQQLTDVTAKVIDEDSFSEELEREEVFFFGDGADKCQEVITHPNATFVRNFYPSAKDMGRLSENDFQQKAFEDVAYFEPYYLKDFVAGVKK